MQREEHDDTFTRWVAQYQGLLFKVVRSHEVDPDSQQDLLQEILVQLWRSLPSFSGRCKESTWIYRVALNTAFGWRRSETNRRNRNEYIAAFYVATNDQLNSAEHGDQLEQLYEAIRKLSKPDAAIIVMHLDGLGPSEIAEVLGITPNNSGVKLNRARHRLAKILKGEEQ